MIKSLKKIGIISIVMCLIVSLNCYAVGGDKIDPDGITTGSANLTNEQSILITNNIRYQMYIKENEYAYGKLENITADKVQEAIEACNAAGYQPKKTDVNIYISNNPTVLKEIPKKTDDGKMVFTYGNGQSVSSKIVTNEDSDKFAVINSAVGSAVDAVQKIDAEKNVIDKILSQNNFDLAENSGLGSLFGVITTAEEMAEYLNRDDITPEARKAFQEAMKAGQGAAGILYFKDPEVNKFVAQIGCKSPTDFLAYLDSKKKDEGLIGSIWQNTDSSSASGTYNFLKTAAEIQSFYGKLCAAMYQSSNGSKVTIENGEKEGFLFDEAGILIGIPQETIDEMEKNGSGTIEISAEMRKAFEIILNGIGKDINVGALKDLLNKNPWTIKELTAFQKLTGAEKIKGSDEA